MEILDLAILPYLLLKKYFNHAGIDFKFDTINDISGKIDIYFDPLLLKSSNFKDLMALGEIAPTGKMTVNTLVSTRRMIIKPEYLENCKVYLKKYSDDIPILVSIHHSNSDIQLMSCHYSEISNISDIDTNKLIAILRLEKGDEYANNLKKYDH